MSYRKKSNTNFTSLLSGLVILMIVVVVLGFLFFRTDGLTTSLKQFYVKYGNEIIVGDVDNFNVVLNKEYKFEICSETDDIAQVRNYYVSVIPNSNVKSFEFNVDDVSYNYSDITSLTSGFIINASDKYFTFKANTDLLGLLQEKYNSDNVSNVPNSLDTLIPYFRLVITKTDIKDVININFNIKSE